MSSIDSGHSSRGTRRNSKKDRRLKVSLIYQQCQIFYLTAKTNWEYHFFDLRSIGRLFMLHTKHWNLILICVCVNLLK